MSTEILLPHQDELERPQPIDASGAIRGGRCAACRAASFPRAFVCPACRSTDIADEAFPSVGTLYTATTVHISSTFATPYRLGYVDLDMGLRILGRLDESVAEDFGTQRVEAAVDLESATGWTFRARQEVSA